jgi:hypothetical protein
MNRRKSGRTAVSNEVERSEKVVAARRRLVRGVFAAPAALTLCSGSVYAASSNLSCVVNANAEPVNAPAEAPNTWVRVEVWNLGRNDKLSTWVYGNDLKMLKASDTPDPYLSSSQWQCISSASSNSGYSSKQIVNSTPMKGSYSPQRSGKYVAVRVDLDGKIIGVQGLEAGGSAVSLFCWASLTVNA